MAKLSIRIHILTAFFDANLGRPASILKSAEESADALLSAFELARQTRGQGAAPRGMTADDEQDLLRAMLVMAGAGLDAMTKQLIKDSIPRLIKCDGNVLTKLEKFVARQIIRGDSSAGEQPIGRDFLARVLASANHQEKVVVEYVEDLTKGSLQSQNALLQVIKALGLDPKAMGMDVRRVRDIFEIRNVIIHEYDINFDGWRRIRNLRSAGEMVKCTNDLLAIANKLLSGVYDKLRTAPVPPTAPIAVTPINQTP